MGQGNRDNEWGGGIMRIKRDDVVRGYNKDNARGVQRAERNDFGCKRHEQVKCKESVR